MENRKLFIYTADKSSADKLRAAGFQQISADNTRWIFANSKTINFNFEGIHVCFTNKLSF